MRLLAVRNLTCDVVDLPEEALTEEVLKGSTVALLTYFKNLLDILLDQNNKRAIIQAQDIFSTLHLIVVEQNCNDQPKVFEEIRIDVKCGAYAINRLKRQLAGRTELNTNEVGKLKLYFEVLDVKYEWKKQLQDAESTTTTGLTGEFYFNELNKMKLK